MFDFETKKDLDSIMDWFDAVSFIKSGIHLNEMGMNHHIISFTYGEHRGLSVAELMFHFILRSDDTQVSVHNIEKVCPCFFIHLHHVFSVVQKTDDDDEPKLNLIDVFIYWWALFNVIQCQFVYHQLISSYIYMHTFSMMWP